MNEEKKKEGGRKGKREEEKREKGREGENREGR